MVRAVHDFRGTYNVKDYRWFNLRDSQTGSPQVFQNSGLLEDDYDEKPAFAAYRDLVRELSVRSSGEEDPEPARPRLVLRLRFRAGRISSGRRCARSNVRASVAGADRDSAREATFFRDGRRVARDARRPLTAIIDSGPDRARATRHRALARVRLADGRSVRISRRYRVCATQKRPLSLTG